MICLLMMTHRSLGLRDWIPLSAFTLRRPRSLHVLPPLLIRMTEEANPELETFRQQWREEVTARSKGTSAHQHGRPARPASAKSVSQSKVSGPPTTTREPRNEVQEDFEDDLVNTYHDLDNKDDARRSGELGEGVHPDSNVVPRSALEHFEKAVEKEAQGNLGDSLNHYRRAYRVTPLHRH